MGEDGEVGYWRAIMWGWVSGICILEIHTGNSALAPQNGAHTTQSAILVSYLTDLYYPLD